MNRIHLPILFSSLFSSLSLFLSLFFGRAIASFGRGFVMQSLIIPAFVICGLIAGGPTASGEWGAKTAHAHFGMIIPSDSMVAQNERRALSLDISFSHPFEIVGMNMKKPAVFGVVAHDEALDLRGYLRKIKIMGADAWTADYKITRPGAHIFYMEPAPYWESGEDCFIIHYTKTVAAAFGDDEGWDREIGLKTEIVPLSKPYGLYAGNLFQGIVKRDGKPVAWAQVEVEFYNQDKSAHAPSEHMITQTIKADANGLFSYAAPKAGWWGFAALTQANETLTHDGVEKEVELGAVIWVKFHDWK